MDSRWDLTRLRELNDKTLGSRKKFAELDSELRIDSTVSSTTFDSIDSSENTRTLNNDREHVKGCASKYRQCTCELLTRYKMRQEKRKQWSNCPNRGLPSNDTINSTILAGNVGSTSAGTSRASSDSFHSAQSITDDIQVVYSNIGDASNESTAGSLNIAVNESKPRDTNHNIDSNQEIESESEKPPVTSEIEDSTSYMMPFLEKISNEIDICSPSTNTQRPNLMKRLSKSFARNPAEFAEKLLTIIEETNLNSCQHPEDKSCANLSRLTTEFRKACKYIMNESMLMDQSMPAEMLTSPIDLSMYIVPGISTSPVTPSGSNSSPQRKSSVDFRTPPHENQKHVKKKYRKTPKNLMENAQKSNQSPLCIAMLKKASDIPKKPSKIRKNTGYSACSPYSADSSHKTLTPVIEQSPFNQCNATLKTTNGTPRTPKRTPTNAGYNDSFIYWENYAHKNATPVSEGKMRSLMRRSKSVPDVAAQLESARIKRTGAIQYYDLEDSPPSSLHYMLRKTSADNVLYDTFDSHPNHDSNLPETVLEEVVKKRLRCCETEKMIREIDATSVSPDDTPEDDIVLEYLKFVRRSSDYHKYLNKNKEAINKAVKKIEDKLTAPKQPIQPSMKTPGKLMESTKKLQPIMSELKRPAFVVNFRRRSPVAVSTTPKGKSPVRLNQGETSLYLRRLSAKKTTLRSTSPPVRHPTTPRITNPRLALTRSTPNLTLTAKPGASELRPVSGGQTPSRPLSVAKTPAKLSVVRTPAKINPKNGFTMSSVTVRSKTLQTPNPGLTKSKSAQNLPVLSVTPATPRPQTTTCARDKKLTQNLQKSGVTGGRLLQTLAKSREKSAITYRSGKVFSTPAKSEQKTCSFFSTPKSMQAKSSVFSKRGKYFETPVKSEANKKPVIPSASKVKKTFVGSAVYYSYDTVKSPVAEYINSTDAKFVQNIRSKDNEFLLTPKKKATTSTETLSIKLGGTNEIKKNPRGAENDENMLDAPMDSFPKVVYQPSAAVHDINCSPSSKLRGGRGKVLREMNDRRVIVRHEARIQDNVAEQSIHISKPAEKSNYAVYSQAAKKPFK
ncbi:uncharacterized protein LOC107046476 [Diachasma alloeum]|uniref:uncharacterized protein LOC107046476 n=1 Tax=Diachasma alloeum TaxID=454923 RepID=UPI00073833EA|nr:uncharacterized protein LOC107046476 [Diachasma alloeum]